MKKERLNKLKDLFSVLSEWSLCNERHQMFSWVELNLEIIWVLTEDRSVQKPLRDYLGCASKIGPDSTENLKRDFYALDMTLEEELRGFSRMLDFVLEDVELRVNSDEIFDELPKKYNRFAFHFRNFLNQAEALRDLETAYDFCQPKALVLLFLNHLVAVANIGEQSIEKAHHLICSWLVEREATALWARFFDGVLDYSDVASVLRYCQNKRDGWQEVCCAFLCDASANSLLISQDHLDVLDGIMASMGLDGAAPLLESGFLRVEGFSKQEKAATIYYLA